MVNIEKQIEIEEVFNRYVSINGKPRPIIEAPLVKYLGLSKVEEYVEYSRPLTQRL
jgi:hypothetical protein